MSDTEHPEIAPAAGDLPLADGMVPPSADRAISKTTHDVDTDDMFDPLGG